jgi:hypothetical protein
MNRPTKLLFAALGVTASSGLWSQFSTKPLIVNLPVPTPDPFACVCPPAPTMKPAPVSTPKSSSDLMLVVCQTCGEKYELLATCMTDVPSTGVEIRHLHLPLLEEQKAIKRAHGFWKYMHTVDPELVARLKPKLLIPDSCLAGEGK